MLVANGHMKTVLKKFCMMLMEKNDFVQIVLFSRLLCSSCMDLKIFFHAIILLYYEIVYCDKICRCNELQVCRYEAKFRVVVDSLS